MENQVILYQPNETIKVDVRLDGETVWLTQEQMCVLFGRERSVITKHIRNVFKEGELDERVSCAKFAPDALMVPDGKGGFVQNLHKTDAEREISQVKSGMNYLIKQITTPPKPPKRKPIGFHVKYD